MSQQTETMEFQAEVKKILDIVIHSLYTEKDIFLRELVSNAADALEKFRHQRVVEKEVFDEKAPLEISIQVNSKDKTLTIVDAGIGMTRDELIHNLGTIAHSGSKTFLTELSEASRKDVSLIGQFGVGFYAAFMVAKNVRVQSRSWHPEAEGHEWSSDGSGAFTVSPCPGLHRGTKIILELSDEAKHYADEDEVRRIIKQYSNFVPFPIKVKGEIVNTVQALWTRSKTEIKDEEYNEFYKFIGGAFEEPLMRLHFSTDVPLSIRALLFVPQESIERLGFGKTEPGVSLYCQRVLIEQHSKTILPEWLRFLRGVIDSEDLPLNISRQALQDSALVAKINKVVTSRFLKFLDERAGSNPEEYDKFWKQFGVFLKEGATSDFTHRDEIAKLLRFESSKTTAGAVTSLADYIKRMRDGQEEIYYINGPSREAVEAGPYIEAFRKRDLEILFTLEPIDDFALSHLGSFDGKKLVSADRADIKLPDAPPREDDDKTKAETLPQGEVKELTAWMKEVLGERVKEVVESHRLDESPAMIVNPDGFLTSSMERIMRATHTDTPFSSAKNLEINTHHPLLRNLLALKSKEEPYARLIVEQIYDNALIQAGLIVESRKMVERSYRILERAVGVGK